MKIINLIKKIGYKFGAALSLSMVSMSAFADDSSMSVSSLTGSIQTLSGSAALIVMTIATIAGVILVVKGLVHLKQHYAGSGGQEKHLSKGVASLGFGAALILAIPITHMLTSSVDTTTGFNTGVSNISFS